QRESGTWLWLGKLQAMAVTCARTCGGKTPRCPTAWRVSQRTGRHPASAPGAHGAISGAHDRGNLLIALLGMVMGRQNDPGSHRQGLGRRVRSDEVLKVFGFFS